MMNIKKISDVLVHSRRRKLDLKEPRSDENHQSTLKVCHKLLVFELLASYFIKTTPRFVQIAKQMLKEILCSIWLYRVIVIKLVCQIIASTYFASERFHIYNFHSNIQKTLTKSFYHELKSVSDIDNLLKKSKNVFYNFDHIGSIAIGWLQSDSAHLANVTLCFNKPEIMDNTNKQCFTAFNYHSLENMIKSQNITVNNILSCNYQFPFEVGMRSITSSTSMICYNSLFEVFLSKFYQTFPLESSYSYSKDTVSCSNIGIPTHLNQTNLMKTIAYLFSIAVTLYHFVLNFSKTLLQSWRDIVYIQTFTTLNYFSLLHLISDSMYMTAMAFSQFSVTYTLRHNDLLSVFIGLSLFASWVSILDLLGSISMYHVIKNAAIVAMPEIIKFMMYVAVPLLAFAICGWIILSPFHSKFLTLERTLQTLFGLMNGDDVFQTFVSLNPKYPLIVLFGHIYIYTFLTLFLFIVLALLYSIFNDAFEKAHSHVYNNLDNPVMQNETHLSQSLHSIASS